MPRRVAVGVMCLFLMVQWVGLQFVFVAFPGHNHLLSALRMSNLSFDHRAHTGICY